MADGGGPGDAAGREQAGDGRAARWAGQRAKRRAEIVRAALFAIGEHGPGVSTQQIAARAGIARPQLYRHFTDADDLYRAIAQHAAGRFLAAMDPTLIRPTGTAAEVIRRIVHTFVAWLTDNLAIYHYLLVRSADSVAGGAPAIADIRGAISARLRTLLAGYLALFDRDPERADPLAFGLVGMVESTAVRWTVAPGVFDRDELVEQLSDWIWAVLDTALRTTGVTLDPHIPLPPLPAPTD